MTKMRSAFLIVAAAVSGACGRVTPTAAAPETYEYRIEHPKYGEIGRYTNVVFKTGEDTEVDSELHVTVKILGIVVYREEARRSERWREDKLVSFRSETITNGNKLEVRGEAAMVASSSTLRPGELGHRSMFIRPIHGRRSS